MLENEWQKTFSTLTKEVIYSVADIAARLYIAKIPERQPNGIEIDDIFPKKRSLQIRETKNSSAQREKYFAWRLLETGVFDFFQKRLSSFNINKSDTGRWSSEEFDFSISHSGDACAVLISTDGKCGVDIQKAGKPHRETFAKRILCEKEFLQYSLLDDPSREDFLISSWCGKEALYKCGEYNLFIPKKIETATGVVKKTVTVGGVKYHLAAAGNFGEEIKIIEITLE